MSQGSGMAVSRIYFQGLHELIIAATAGIWKQVSDWKLSSAFIFLVCRSLYYVFFYDEENRLSKPQVFYSQLDFLYFAFNSLPL